MSYQCAGEKNCKEIHFEGYTTDSPDVDLAGAFHILQLLTKRGYLDGQSVPRISISLVHR